MESENESTKSEIDENEEREKIRNEIATMSFEDLQKLKNKMGSKLYNKNVLGVEPRNPKTNFKRVNKNRPREMSAKIRPKFKKTVAVVEEKKFVSTRDPRFDPLCGSFDKDAFTSNYKFLGEVRKNERKQLLTELQETNDPDRKKKIKLLVQRMDNQIREQDKHDTEKQKIIEEKREIKEQFKRGEKPIFKKKSERKIEDLLSKYEELKKKNKLQKHIEKRSKKLAVRDRKKLEQ